jgi:hypothetical protein
MTTVNLGRDTELWKQWETRVQSDAAFRDEFSSLKPAFLVLWNRELTQRRYSTTLL